MWGWGGAAALADLQQLPRGREGKGRGRGRGEGGGGGVTCRKMISACSHTARVRTGDRAALLGWAGSVAHLGAEGAAEEEGPLAGGELQGQSLKV